MQFFRRIHKAITTFDLRIQRKIQENEIKKYMVVKAQEVEIAQTAIEQTTPEAKMAIDRLKLDRAQDDRKRAMEEFRPSDKVAQMDYIYNQLSKGLCIVKSITISDLEPLWNKIRSNADSSPYFNLSYYYFLLKQNDKYCASIVQQSSASVILACLLHRFSGKNRTFTVHARDAASFLEEHFNFPAVYVKNIQRLIETCADLNYATLSAEENVFLNLRLSRLGCPFDLFVENQELIQRDATYLPKKEFYRNQQLIYSQLLNKKTPIFTIDFFKLKYEEAAKNNIAKYLKILQEKIIAQKVLDAAPPKRNPLIVCQDHFPGGSDI